MAKKKTRQKPKPPAKRRPLRRLAPAKPEQTVALMIRDPHQILPTETVNLPVPRSVNDETQMIYGIGVDQVEITAAEEAVLSENIDERLIRWKPQKKGLPIPYVSWTGYTKWMNRAFGRTGWRMVPAGKPIKGPNSTVLQPHVLFLKGKAYATAWGEQDWFENNVQQTYGDAVESTRASALRRCMKQLGVGIELWDKEWVDACRRRHHKAGQEDDGSRRRERTEPPPPPKATARSGEEDERITTEQRQRLFLIGKRAGRTKPEIIAYVKDVLRLRDSSQITRRNYQAVVDAIEKPGPLPEPAREPDAILDSDIKWDLRS